MARLPPKRPSSIWPGSSKPSRQSVSATRPAPRRWGAFGGGAGGSWGSFASGVARSTAGSLANGGLLPHEREARKQTAASAPPPKPTPAAPRPTPPNPAPRGQRPTRGGLRHGLAEAQVNMSRSVLANVFNTDREPRSRPTPVSWTAPDQHSASKASPGGVAGPAQSPPAQPRPGLGLYGNRKLTVLESPKPSGSPGPPQRQAWGSFGDRRAQTAEHVAQPAGRDGVAHTIGSFSSMLELANASKQPPSKPRANDEDFWGELENRFASFKDNSRKGREAAAAPWTAKQTQEGSSKPAHDANTHKSGGGQDTTLTEVQRQRRLMRYEIEDESMRNQTLKKSKKVHRRGRGEQDDSEWDDEAVYRWEQRQRAKAEKEARKQRAVPDEPTAVPIFLPEYISVSNLGQALKQRANRFLKDMEEMGFENITLDTIMAGDTAALVAMEYGFEPTIDTGSQRDLRPRPPPAEASSLPGRPPIVTIMGHVDHGKTTLLDWLRKSSVAAQEHGGITQHIGAFVVKMSSGKPITFLDTPGHAAFLSMRQRGANVTDIVVLVVAADDSVMPQTIEALKHATAAKVPIIVAINKIDKEDARVDQVKIDLSRHGVEIEDYGGDVQVVCVSGKTGQGMNDLEENIVTLSEVLDVRAETDGMAEGWVLESSIKQDGKVATVLVKRGTLRLGDFIVAGKSWARIRLLRNEAGTELDEASAGTPVEVLGWRDLPPAGEQVLQAPDEGKAKSAVEYRMEMANREESSLQLAEQEQRQREKAAAEAAEAAAAAAGEEAPAESTIAEQSGVLQQNFCVKADVVGSVEAVCSSILELGNHEAQATILRSSAGQISEYDVDHAAASNSILVNFNMPVLPHIKQRAEAAKVRILDHSVIYHVVDDVKAALSALLPEAVSTRVVGEADILQVFSINTKKRTFKNIAGCKVRNGAIKRSSRIKVLRKGRVIYDGHIDTLKHVKKDVMEMGKGTECGIGLEGFQDFAVDDQIQTYEEIKEKRSL
ncbi:elongation factor tu GTP binding domain-containing protein [Hirsutella rhossiliensis]|uniref:Translation initiation factor IF-2, mitochondrial n=1 Tax=Hirsutella rhossiliensis TaxID=111463 RepID=A0A9P8SDI8_9HYPO|nr:elongation factor tu GTP binding domain-containing protein [Hirsutella rhossiliensis]KAH0958009.1 elongation factor tu GTP binding domain-containing protein [Hirsutella rhossiliensis]